MGYEFAVGPQTTSKSVEQVASVIKEVGTDVRFMSFMRRTGIKSKISTGLGSFEYGPFAPNDNDDPFASAGRKADWRVGWAWSGSVTNSMNMTLNQGWTIIFSVFDDGGTRSVSAQIAGSAIRKEPTRFAEQVFKLL